jgi:hypothetical protein
MLAVWRLLRKGSSGNTVLEDSTVGGAAKLTSMLTAWGIAPATITRLLNELPLTSPPGDFTQLGVNDQIEILNAFQTNVLGNITMTDITTSFPGALTVLGIQLAQSNVANLRGTINFSTIPADFFVSEFEIGAFGDINIGLNLPDMHFHASLSSFITWEGWLTSAGLTAAACFLFPFGCPGAIVLVGLLIATSYQSTVLDIIATGVEAVFNLAFSFNETSGLVEPVVTLVSNSGSTSVTNTGSFWSLIPDAADALLESVVNMFGNQWLPVAFLGGAGTQIQNSLLNAGVQFPQGPSGIVAADGGATSAPGSLLRLFAEIMPSGSPVTLPYITQVQVINEVLSNLEIEHLAIETELNPQPATIPPPLFPVASAGCYCGFGVSQNALNYYLYQRWINGDFGIEVTDPNVLAPILSTLPMLAFQTHPGMIMPDAIHVWPATPPRVEISMTGILDGTANHGKRPVVFFFDDIRVCFEKGMAPTQFSASSEWELSLNAKTTGTLDLGWPLKFNLLLDSDLDSIAPIDGTTWEFVNPSNVNMMARLPAGVWLAGGMQIVSLLLTPFSAASIVPPSTVSHWSRRMAAMQQSLVNPAITTPSVPSGVGSILPPQVPESFYLEILGFDRTLFALPVFETELLQLVDGSGAPFLNAILGTGTSPVSLLTMTHAQGEALRSWADDVLKDSLGQFIVPPPQ